MFQVIWVFHERMILHIKVWNALSDLVPLVQFKKREKHPWRSFLENATLQKATLLHGCFLRFMFGTQLHKTSDILEWTHFLFSINFNFFLYPTIFNLIISMYFWGAFPSMLKSSEIGDQERFKMKFKFGCCGIPVNDNSFHFLQHI